MADEKIGEMYVELKARMDSLEKDLKTAKGKTKKAGEDAGKSFATSFNKALGYVGITLGVTALIGVLTKAVKLFIESERVERKFTAALGRKSEELIRYAKTLQRITIYDDEAILQAQTRIAAFTKEEGQIKKLTAAVVAFASAKEIDLVTAADLMAKTFGSSTNALTRYGIEIEGVAGSNQRLESIVARVQKLFGGLAEAEAKTLAGRLVQLQNETENLGEDLGEHLVPALENLASGFTSVEETGKKISPMFKVIGTAALLISQPIVNLVNMIKGFVSNIKGALGAVILLAKGDLVGAFEVLGQTTLDAINNVYNYGKAHVDTYNDIKDLWKDGKDFIQPPASFDFDTGKIRPFVIPKPVIPGGTEDELNEELVTAQKTVFDEIKFLSQDYIDYKINLINKEAEAYQKLGVNVVAVEIWKFNQLRRMWQEYDDFWKLTAKGMSKTTIDVSKETVEQVEGFKKSFVIEDDTLLGLEATVALMDSLKEKIIGAGQSFAYLTASTVVVFRQANSMLQQYINLLVQAIAQAVILAAVTKFITTPILGLLGLAQTGGSFTQAGKQPAQAAQPLKKMATGGSFIVPQGFDKDNFMIGVKSGERVTVDTSDKVSKDRMKTLTSNNSVLLNRFNVLIANVQELVADSTFKQKAIPIEGEVKGTDIYLSNKKTTKIIKRFT